MELKERTAGALKWNLIDRVGSQLLYAVTGIILARELSQEAFGLVGAILVFQAFALLFVDSGFSYALIQRKQNTELGYSTVYWFNLLMACALYALLWVCAPLIADCFGGDARLIPLSRVMFLSFILNALAIVQTNRLAKQMNFKPIALTNMTGLAAGAVVGIWMAFAGFGPWSIVWQTITINAVKAIALGLYSKWIPMLKFSMTELRNYFSVGAGMMGTSFLNVLFQNIYSFFVGNRAGIVPLGYYTQSDKWSKMGVTAISQILTSSFLPALSEVQDDPVRFRRVVSKMNRFTGYLLFPTIFFLIAAATPVFHTLFGAKWDPSILLFQLLLFRGIFTVLNSLYNNYLLALGKSATIFRLEILRDVVAAIGLVITFPFMTISLTANPVYGLGIMLWGQIAASVIAFLATIICTSRATGISIHRYLLDMAPYLASSLLIGVAIFAMNRLAMADWAILLLQVAFGLSAYIAVNAFFPSKIQREVLSRLIRR